MCGSQGVTELNQGMMMMEIMLQSVGIGIDKQVLPKKRRFYTRF